MTRRDSSASRSSSSSRKGARGAPRARTDGKVDVSCPQCGCQYRIAEEKLDSKIECQDCHRVFFAKTTAGKRAVKQDHSKVYVGFGVGAVVLILIFVMMSSSGTTPAKPAPSNTPPKQASYSVGTHPRAIEIAKWANAISSNNELVMSTHSDLEAVAKKLEIASSEPAAVCEALRTSEQTRFFRELTSDAALASEADMTAASGKALVYVTPKTGDDTYLRNTRGEFAVTFRMDGNDVKVTGWELTMKPNRDPKKGDPSRASFKPDANIAAPQAVEITDSAGTRKVQESQPGPVPHWEKATPQQQQLADQVTADVLRSADPEAPGALFNRALDKVRTMEERQAVAPRLLNAMHDCYADVMANNQKLSQLNRAMVTVTGFAVNYQVATSSDGARDKKERESAVRQWFAFWWRYHGDLSKYVDTRDNLDEPLDDPKAPQKK